jgi:sortase B
LNKKVYLIIIVLLSLLFIYSFKNIFNSHKEEQINKVIAVEGNIKKENNNKDKFINYQKEYNNEEIKGLIKIAGTNINNLFAVGEDNSYYLKHTLKKGYSKYGAIFADYRTDFETSKQINIYGHNSTKYNVPFHDLLKYLNNDFTKEHNIINIETESYNYNYQIYNIRLTKSDEHINLDYTNDEDWLNHLDKMRENSIYDSKVKVTTKDQILVLQTCLLDGSNRYLIISAKRV